MKNPLEKPNKTEKPLYICVCSQWIFGEIVTPDVTRTSVLAFVSSVRSPLTSSSLAVTNPNFWLQPSSREHLEIQFSIRAGIPSDVFNWFLNYVLLHWHNTKLKISWKWCLWNATLAHWEAPFCLNSVLTWKFRLAWEQETDNSLNSGISVSARTLLSLQVISILSFTWTSNGFS